MSSLPPAGWYPDPRVMGGHRYWDGEAWTDEATTAYGEAVGGRPPLGPHFALLATATQVLLALCAVAWGLGAVSSWWALQRLGEPGTPAPTEPLATWALDWLRALLLALTATAFIAWLHRAHRSDRMHAESLDHTSASAIWGWFVPPLCLWRPAAVVDEVRVGALNVEPPRGGGLLGAWWAAWLVTLVMTPASAAPDPAGAGSARELRDGLTHAAEFGIVAGAAGALAGLLAVFVVRHLTARVLASESLTPA